VRECEAAAARARAAAHPSGRAAEHACRTDRRANLLGVFAVVARHAKMIEGRDVVLLDDVVTPARPSRRRARSWSRSARARSSASRSRARTYGTGVMFVQREDRLVDAAFRSGERSGGS